MQRVLKGVKIFFFLFSISVAIPACADDEILLLSSDKVKVSLQVKNQLITGKELQTGLDYKVIKAVADHLLKADKVGVIRNKNNQHGSLFIVLSVEPSRPNSMGRGYCGAGHEFYLLLVEAAHNKIKLHDQLLLQSCLKSISMFVDHGSDMDAVENGLIANDDGSFRYRLLEDEADQERKLVVCHRRFEVSLVPVKNYSAAK